MLWETISVMRDLPRLHEIATVMIRYGWGDLVRVLGISGVLERAGRVLHWQSTSEISQLDAPVRIRRALEELGPTFVKLGQLLATRVDMFPPHWITEFEKLHSQVPAVPYELLHPDLVAAIKGEPGDVFATLRSGSDGGSLDCTGTPRHPQGWHGGCRQDPPSGYRRRDPGRSAHHAPRRQAARKRDTGFPALRPGANRFAVPALTEP